MELHPQIIEKDGKQEFVVLSYHEFLQLQEQLEDYEDLKALRESKAEGGMNLSLSALKRALYL